MMRPDSCDRLAPYSSAALRPSATCRTLVEPMQNLRDVLYVRRAWRQRTGAAAAARPAARLLVSWCSSLSSLNLSFRMF